MPPGGGNSIEEKPLNPRSWELEVVGLGVFSQSNGLLVHGIVFARIVRSRRMLTGRSSAEAHSGLLCCGSVAAAFFVKCAR